MPQMSPMLWLNLFIMFSVMMILMNQILFFSFKNMNMKMMKKEMINISKTLWKW